MTDESPLVLVVEDEPDLADLYAAWLADGYRVRTAYGGCEALDALDEEVAVVLLDRRMPDLSGDEVLTAVRDRGIDCRVAMVTAVEPDFDVLEMGFDDYLVKPVTKEALRETVSNLHLRSAYDAGVQELFSLASKRALLESEKGETELRDSEEYADLDERIRALRSDLDDALRTIDDHDAFVGICRDLERGGSANDFADY
ncbi:HalX domain-containing protein [Halegenticoccus soli]|uniref:HalX domain-containing protein n=1 Tax=Halegenticoccus soli TaxID=1985678 RepID=UPI000C6EFE9F|nr:HalX domain-containing protein [Halegenticoccus soli]